MRPAVPVVAVLVFANWSRADSGDIGSLRKERELFPDAIEVMTGKFVRHSPEFYRWQIQDREKRLAGDPKNPTLADELAVANAMIGERDKAIALMEKQAADHPDRYECHANLALFYFQKKDFAKALPPADRALAINADANSGREKYLRWIAEYALEKPGQRLPLAPVDANSEWPHRPRSFAIFLRAKLGKPDLDLSDAQTAVRGVLQIMRFGSHQFPVLLEVLGDLLSYSSDSAKPYPKRLATRAYLRAAYSVDPPGIRAAYITLAEWAMVHREADHGSYRDSHEAMPVLTRLFAEVDDAIAWHEELSTKERALIDTSADPEGDINRLYAAEPQVPDDPGDSWLAGDSAGLYRLLAMGAIGVMVLIVLFVLVGRVVGRRGKRSSIA